MSPRLRRAAVEEVAGDQHEVRGPLVRGFYDALDRLEAFLAGLAGANAGGASHANLPVGGMQESHSVTRPYRERMTNAWRGAARACRKRKPGVGYRQRGRFSREGNIVSGTCFRAVAGRFLGLKQSSCKLASSAPGWAFAALGAGCGRPVAGNDLRRPSRSEKRWMPGPRNCPSSPTAEATLRATATRSESREVASSLTAWSRP